MCDDDVWGRVYARASTLVLRMTYDKKLQNSAKPYAGTRAREYIGFMLKIE
jgi:hypothetical protein